MSEDLSLSKQAENIARQKEGYSNTLDPKRILDDPKVQQGLNDLATSNEKTASFGAVKQLKEALVKQAGRLQERARAEERRRLLKQAQSKMPEDALNKLDEAFNQLLENGRKHLEESNSKR